MSILQMHMLKICLTRAWAELGKGSTSLWHQQDFKKQFLDGPSTPRYRKCHVPEKQIPELSQPKPKAPEGKDMDLLRELCRRTFAWRLKGSSRFGIYWDHPSRWRKAMMVSRPGSNSRSRCCSVSLVVAEGGAEQGRPEGHLWGIHSNQKRK